MRVEAERKELDYVIIRPYKPGDYEALSQLYLVNWPETDPFHLTVADDFTCELGEIIFVAESGGEMVGGIYYYPRRDHAYLHTLVVKKECRGQGIATEMLKVAEEQATTDGFARITIDAETDELARYYEALGFRHNPHTKKGLVKDIG